MRLTDAEWRLMQVLWTQAPASARTVMSGLDQETNWAYTTVKTMLSRLTDKGALAAEMKFNTTFYDPVITKEEARRSAIKSLMERAFDGAFDSMLQFLVHDEKLTVKDRAELDGMLQSMIDEEESAQ